MLTRLTLVLGCVVLASTAMLLARQQERPALANAVRAFVSIDAPVVALTHARVIDGTGSAPREDQTNPSSNAASASTPQD